MDARNDLARPAAGFKTREEGTLACGKCGQCGGEAYRVPEGSWLHWATLTEACPTREGASSEGRGNDLALESLSDGQEGGKL